MVDTLLVISFEELCQVERLNQELIVEVIDYGIAEPVSGDDKNDWMFDTSSVRWVKKAITLYSQLELDWVAVAMIVELLKQKEMLEYNRITKTPDDLYKDLLVYKPHWLQNIPQYHIASYLTITPETLSRIRKRIS